MSRYAAMFERLGAEGAFGAFLMLGDPDLKTCARLLDEVVAAGADMIEVGIPFSDPVADGPVIQAAAQRALAAGANVDACFALLAEFRDRHPEVPVGVLTYANLVMARPGFYRDAAEAGVHSLQIADLPALEAEPGDAERSILIGLLRVEACISRLRDPPRLLLVACIRNLRRDGERDQPKTELRHRGRGRPRAAPSAPVEESTPSPGGC